MANARRYRTEFVITGDSRSAVKANDDARESTERLTREMQQAERQSERTSDGLMMIGSRAGAMAAAIGLSVSGIAAMTAQTAAAVREQTNLANAVGVSVQTLQGWSYAGRQVGIDSEKMGDIFKDTADKIGDAFANGGGEAMDALNALNLSAADLIKLSPDQQILAIGERLKGLPKAQQVTILESIADDASRLAPLLENNGELLREYAQQARDLRIVLPQEDIDRLDEAGQSLQYLQEAGRGLAQTVAADLSPAIDYAAETVDGLVDTLGGMEGVVDKGQAALTGLVAVMTGRLAMASLAKIKSVREEEAATLANIRANNTAIETERRAAAEALRLAQSRQASAKQALANAQATAAATGITTNRTKAITQLAAANVELTSAEQRHAAAMAASTTTATRYSLAMGRLGTAARGTLALLGGWPGLLLTAGAALYTFASDADDARDSIDPLTQSTDEFTKSLKSMTVVTANAALVRLGEQIDDTRDQMRDAAQDVSYLDGMLAGKGPVPVRGAERVRMENDLALARERLQDVTESYNEQLERQDQLQQVANGTWKDAAEAANDAAGGITRVGDALGTSADKWDDYLGKLQAARDTLGMTTAEAAEYAAAQAGYTGLYAEQSGAIAGQTDALKGYQTALEEGDQAEADVQLARAQRFAESEAMVQAQLANLNTLSGLLQGVQSDLSATALSAALVVGEGAGGTAGLVEQALATIEARAAAIRETTTFGSKASTEAKELAKSLRDAEQTYDSLREQFDPLGKAADDYAEKQAALNLLQQQGKITAEQAAQAQAELTQQYRESIDPLQGILDRMDPGAALLREYREDVENLRTAADTAGRSQLEITAGIAQLAAEYAKAEKEADPYYQRTLELRQEYDSSALKARQLQKDLADLNQRYRDGKIGPEEYQRSVASVRDEMRDLALESDPAAQEMARAWEEAADRIDETFADAFAGAFDSFDDFSDQLLDGFKQLLAELAYQAALRPIVVGFTADAQNLLGLSGTSAGSSAGGAGLGGFANTIAGAKRVWDTGSAFLSGGSAIGGATAAGYGAAGWAGSATGAYTGWAGSAAAGAASASSIGSMAAAAMPYVGAALVADQVLLGGAISNTIGKAISGIGDALGFGSSRDYKAGLVSYAETPDGPAEDRYYDSGNRERLIGGRDSAFGSFGYTYKEKFDVDPLADFLDALQALDNTVASGASAEQIDAVKRSLDGYYTKVKNDPLGDLLTSRYKVIKQALLASSSDVGDALIEKVGDITAENAEELALQLAKALQLGNIIDGLSGNVQDYAETVATNTDATLDEMLAEIQASVSNYTVFSSAAENLNLQFDSLADGAVEASNAVANLAGGVENLQTLQEDYYQNYFSEEERRAKTIDSLTEQIAQFNLSTGQAIESKGGLRDYIESLDLMTEAGQAAYAAALQMVDVYDQLEEANEAVASSFDDLLASAQSQVDSAQSAAEKAYSQFDDQAYQQQLDLLTLLGRDQDALNLQRERELESIDESLRPFQERIWQLQDEAAALDDAKQAAVDYTTALARSQDQLSGTLGSISQWVDQQIATGGSPDVDLQESQAQFARQLVLAQNGDRDALQSITQYADQYLAAGEAYYGSGTGYQSIRDDVLDALEDLPDQVSAEEYVADEIKQALLEQTASITDDLSDVLRGDNPASIAGELAGYFDVLAGGIDGVLTRDQLALIMGDKATDRQLDAMIRALDLNGDDIVSGLESVIVSGMPTDAILANVLQAQLKANGDKALTAAQVRSALSPIATDEQIDSFMRAADSNADGIIDAQELTNSRLGGLSKGIAGALDPMFDQIDSSLDGLIDYDEFGKYFKGLASEDRLREIYNQLDTDGDGQISALEAVKQSTDQVGDNTGSLEQRSLEQLEKLTNLTSEMTRTTDQFVSLNSGMTSLSEAIKALGLAQSEIARIEKEQQEAKAAEQARLKEERQVAALEARIESLTQSNEDSEPTTAKLADRLSDAQVNSINRFLSNRIGSDGIFSADEWSGVQDEINNTLSGTAASYAKYAGSYLYRESRLADAYADQRELSGEARGSEQIDVSGILDQLDVTKNMSREDAYLWRYPDVAEEWPERTITVRNSGADTIQEWARYHYNKYGQYKGRKFALGGAFDNGIVTEPTLFNMGLMGEAGPEAILPLSRGSDGSLGVRAELPPLPAFPLLGDSDVVEAIRDLKREVAQLRAENARLLEESNRHAAAGVRVAQAGHQQQIAATERGNRSLEDMAAGTRLESAR